MRIIARSEQTLSPWVRLVETQVRLDDHTAPETYHSIAQADYVTIVARTRAGLIPIVSQFRPAVACMTLELPGGLVEPGEDAETCCRRELLEETGCSAVRVQALGSWFPDTGRLANRVHVFAVEASDPDPGFVAEPGISAELLSPGALRARLLDGSFSNLMHHGALALAALRGFEPSLFTALRP